MPADSMALPEKGRSARPTGSSATGYLSLASMRKGANEVLVAGRLSAFCSACVVRFGCTTSPATTACYCRCHMAGPSGPVISTAPAPTSR